MGDRVSVTLTVRKEDFDANRGLFLEPDNEFKLNSMLVSLEYYEVTEGCLGIEALLEENRIPYDKSWKRAIVFLLVMSIAEFTLMG